MTSDNGWGASWDGVLGRLDPEFDEDLYEAAIDRELTLEIGLAARLHVRLDQALNSTLAMLTMSIVKPSTTTAPMIKRIRTTISQSPLPGGKRLNSAAMSALNFAHEAYEKRNRVLHDQWIAVFDESGPSVRQVLRTESAETSCTSHPTLEAIQNTSQDLYRAYLRVSAILVIAEMGTATLGIDDLQVEHDTAICIMEGDFHLLRETAHYSTKSKRESELPPWRR